MIFSMTGKRSRDAEDDLDLPFQSMGKRSRPADHSHDVSTLYTPTPHALTKDSFRKGSSSEQLQGSDSPQSNVSEAGSAADIDMDSDDDTENADDDFQMTFSQSPERSTSWSMRPSPIRPLKNPSRHQPSSRVPTPMAFNTVRPRPAPLQTTFGQTTASMGHSNASTQVPRSNMADRLPSPIDEDEPHTPTTAAGSQLSLLTVTDMDVDIETPDSSVPGNSTPNTVIVRKQRQRSGAFISTPDAARKFSMGYRDDCDKCRRKVPGHVNHFLGT